MRNTKRIVAFALAAAMVLSNSLTAFAANDGSSTGAGASEGHVEKKATDVVLPTVPEDNSPFAYTMDPERLILATTHAKYGNAVEFPGTADDTGVYFNNGKKGGDGADKDNIVYASTSAAQKVTNKSSHSIDLTVKAEAVAGDNDIPLVASDEIEDATEASLYLGLKVGAEAAVAVDEETAATKTVSIAGTSDNFDIFVNQAGDGYEYRALTLAEYKALDGNSEKTQADYDATWKTTTFQLEGAVTEDKAITASTTAPSVKVTWSWVDPSANAAPSITPTSGILSSSAIEINYNLGLGDDAATSVTGITFGDTNKNDSGTVASSFYTVDAENNKITLSADYMAILANDGYTTVKFTIAFDNNKTASIVLTAEGD